MLGLLALFAALAVRPALAEPLEPTPPPPETSPAPVVDTFVAPAPLTPLLFPWPEDADPQNGVVVIELLLLVGITGKVEGVTLIGIAGESLDTDSTVAWAIRAFAIARDLPFAPATEAGAPVSVEIPLTLPFTPPPVRLTARVLLDDGTPLQGVTLRVRQGDVDIRVAESDDTGAIEIRGLDDGTYALVLEGPPLPNGKLPFFDSRTIDIAAGQAADVVLYAHNPNLTLGEGLIARYDPVRAEVVKRSLSEDEIRTTPGTMGDPLRAIANLPGAVRTPLDAGWLIVRGGDPRDTGVYIDGLRVPLIYHLGGFTSVIHPGFVDHVDFFPGGQSARYGRSTAGVVDLVTNEPSDGVDVRAGANIILAGAFVSVPVLKAGERKGGVAVGFRRSYLDAFMRAIPSVTDEQAEIAPKFWDWQARGDVSLDLGDFRLFGFGFLDTLDGSTGDSERIVVDFNSQQIQGEWKGRALGKPALIRPYFSYDLRSVTISAADQQQDRLVVGAGTRAELQDDGDAVIGWTAGLDLRVDSFQLAYNDVPRKGWVGSPEAYADLRVGSDTKVVVGLRTDTTLVTDQLPRFGASPRLSVVHPLSQTLDLRADAGVYHQAPTYELLLGPPEGSSLRLEYSWGGGAGVSWKPGWLTLELDAFGRKIENLTQYDADGSLGQGDGLAFGLETMTRVDKDRFAGWLSLSWGRSLRREESSSAWAPAIYDQPLTAVLVGSEDLGKGWSLSGRFRYATGFPAPDDPDASAYDVLRSESVPLTRDSAGRLPAFHSLDAKISRHFTKRKLGLDFYLDIQNVYNRRIPEPVITGISDVYTVQTYGFGLTTLPIFGVEGVYR